MSLFINFTCAWQKEVVPHYKKLFPRLIDFLRSLVEIYAHERLPIRSISDKTYGMKLLDLKLLLQNILIALILNPFEFFNPIM